MINVNNLTISIPKVSVIILNWNNASDTLECLESLKHLDYPNFHILVVDNGSTDNSPAIIREKYPGIEITETRQNLGYAEGNNAGIRSAMEKGADYIFILNNDTKTAPDLLTKLVDAAEASPDIGMVGPQVYCTDPADILFAAGSLVEWEKGNIIHRGMFKKAAACPELLRTEEVDFIVGCGVLVKKCVIEQIGILNPAYYLNYEDVEWGIRAKLAGYKIIYVPAAQMWHKVSATLGLASPANTYYMTRNALYFFRHNAPGIWKWIAPLRIMFRTVWTVLAWTVKNEYHTSSFERKRDANLLALRDFLLNRMGKMGHDVEKVCYQD